MVKFLISRPIAVIMTVLAFSVLGLIAFFTMPVSLLPDIDIPEIKVRVNYPDVDARNLENTVIKPLRQQLLQVGGLKDIESETDDGFSEIKLTFSHSVNVEYAYIEVNEKVDAIINRFPREMERPIVIKAKPSDIPVFFISITPTQDFYNKGDNFNEFSEYVETVVKRRLEQLSDVSMVDITGLDYPQIVIKPFNDKLNILGLNYNDITTAVKKNNIQIGSLSFRDGHYVYRLRLKQALLSTTDFQNIKIIKNGRLFKLSDIAEIKLESVSGNGIFLNNNSRSVSMAVYKQADARMSDISINVKKAISDLKENNPDIDFLLERDQTKLLEYSIKNLKQTLILGIILAMAILFLFIRQSKLPIIISISIPVSLILSFFFLNISGISINIISLSGLILSVGLMIDNSIIIIDNINQYKQSGNNTFDATILGTNEIIRPLISSVLTTCAVFIPMIALSGIAGAIFFDQAITITITLIISLFVSIMVIPVFYNLLVNSNQHSSNTNSNQWLLMAYEKALLYVMNRKKYFIIVFFLLIPIGYVLFSVVAKEKFPELKQQDIVAKVEWNEPISLNENIKRVQGLLNNLSISTQHTSSYIGKNQFTLTERERLSVNSAMIYLNFDRIIDVNNISDKITALLKQDYPFASVGFSPSENIFQTIFNPNESTKIKFRYKIQQNISPDFIEKIHVHLPDSELLSLKSNSSFLFAYEIYPNHDKILLYNLSMQTIIKKLEIILGGSIIDKISSGNKVINILLYQDNLSLHKILNDEFIKNKNGINIPLSSVLEYDNIKKLELIRSDKQGEYYGISIENNNINKEEIESEIVNSTNQLNDVEISFSGSAYEQEILFGEFLMVLSISFILLYLILAAQFESLLLPIIILTEILFDISGALFFLYIFQSSLNLMSALGIIVMSGIIINDSIIKIDAIRQSLKSGKPLTEAIFEGGKRRFYPIVMTSLTTILALIPLLLFGGLGIELQTPLALSIIGGLMFGTFVSLFFIPIMFYFFTRKSKI